MCPTRMNNPKRRRLLSRLPLQRIFPTTCDKRASSSNSCDRFASTEITGFPDTDLDAIEAEDMVTTDVTGDLSRGEG